VSPITHAELYCYPTLEPLKSVNIKELNPNNLLILCTQKGNDKAAYVWRGISVPQEVEDKLYLANVLRQKWPDTDSNNIAIFDEVDIFEMKKIIIILHRYQQKKLIHFSVISKVKMKTPMKKNLINFPLYQSIIFVKYLILANILSIHISDLSHSLTHSMILYFYS